MVVLYAKLTRLINCCARKQKKAMRTEEARQECRFLLVETRKHLTSIAVLTVHAETSLLYIRSVQANRNINPW